MNKNNALKEMNRQLRNLGMIQLSKEILSQELDLSFINNLKEDDRLDLLNYLAQEVRNISWKGEEVNRWFMANNLLKALGPYNFGIVISLLDRKTSIFIASHFEDLSKSKEDRNLFNLGLNHKK